MKTTLRSWVMLLSTWNAGISWFFLLILLFLTLLPTLVSAAPPYLIIKCLTGTPTPASYIYTVNAGTEVTIPAHVAADGIYFVLDSTALPATAGVRMTLKACNAFSCSAPTPFTVDVGAPAPPNAIYEWRMTKP